MTVGTGSLTISERDINAIGIVTGSNFKTGSTNVHNVGVEAAGINVLGADTPIGTGATIYDDGGARFSGIVSATSFVGSGANLTGITETTINNNADNRIITGSGTANTLEGEANLTFSSNQLTVHEAKLKGNQLLFTTSGTAYLDHSTVGQDIQVRVSTSSSQDTTGPTFKSNGNLAFASGKGIDFSASSHATGMSSELLDDYEEGDHDTTVTMSGDTSFSYSSRTLTYTKIGRAVFVTGRINMSGAGGSSFRFTLPFTCGDGSFKYETSNEFQNIRVNDGYTFRIRSNTAYAEMQSDGSDTGTGQSSPHFNVNLFYFTTS